MFGFRHRGINTVEPFHGNQVEINGWAVHVIALVVPTDQFKEWIKLIKCLWYPLINLKNKLNL